MITAVDKSALFHAAGDELPKTQPVKIDLSNSPLWHRWLQPLWAVEQTLPTVFDSAVIVGELAAFDRGKTSSYRTKLLAVLRRHLADTKKK